MTDQDAVEESGEQQNVERLDHQYNSELLPGVRVEDGGLEMKARLKRGGVRNYDRRYVHVDGEGLGLKLRPDDIPAVVAALEALRDAIVTEELETPACIYCGQDLDDITDAREHHAENHVGRPMSDDGDGFYEFKYETDPNGSIRRLREVTTDEVR